VYGFSESNRINRIFSSATGTKQSGGQTAGLILGKKYIHRRHVHLCDGPPTHDNKIIIEFRGKQVVARRLLDGSLKEEKEKRLLCSEVQYSPTQTPANNLNPCLYHLPTTK
jgi:hypothetical protein